MAFVGLEGDRDAALEGLAVRAERLRRLQAHQTGLTLHIPLPAAHRHGPTPPHEEAVADVDLVCRRQRRQARREAIERHAYTQAAIHDEIQQPTVGSPLVGRLQQDEVGPEANSTGLVARRFVEVNDASVCRMLRVDGEVQLAVDALVVERERTATGDFEMRNSHTSQATRRAAADAR
ncbi:MAG TPA: hypothetical protein VKJ07_06785 [Mycobacteriales bacterium]|nr:hypothetical protein [Mycobacteriales bacterium]